MNRDERMSADGIASSERDGFVDSSAGMNRGGACEERGAKELVADPLRLARRSFLATAALGLGHLGMGSLGLDSTAWARDYGPNAQPARYPEPDGIVLDKRFAKYEIGNTPIQRLHTGMLWSEGPAWNGVGKFLMWSDIPNNVQLRWLNDDGHVSIFRQPSGY